MNGGVRRRIRERWEKKEGQKMEEEVETKEEEGKKT